jgi:hypothetical protein
MTAPLWPPQSLRLSDCIIENAIISRVPNTPDSSMPNHPVTFTHLIITRGNTPTDTVSEQVRLRQKIKAKPS